MDLKTLKTYLCDDNLKTIIFEGNKEVREGWCLNNGQFSIHCFSNLMVFFTFLVYKIYLKKKREFDKSVNRERNLQEFSNSLIRLMNFFDSFYTEKNMSLDLFESTILNLEIDFRIAFNKGFLDWLQISRFFNFPKNDNTLSLYFYELKKSKINPKKEHSFTYEKFCEVLKMFPILMDIKIDFERYSTTKYNKIIVSFTNDAYEKVELDEFLLHAPVNNSLYYMDNFVIDDPRVLDENQKKHQALIATYLLVPANRNLKLFKLYFCDTTCYKPAEPLTGQDAIVVGETLIEDIFVKYGMVDLPFIERKSLFFKDYMFFNNKYIKNLAYIIADSLNNEARKDIRRKYSKYETIFKRLGFDFETDNFNIQWDEIIIFLLLEDGIYDFLVYLLVEKYIDYEKIHLEFQMRFGDQVKNITERYFTIANPTINIQSKTRHNIAKAHARAIILLATKLFAENNFELSTNYVPLAINDLMDDIKEICAINSTRNNNLSLISRLTYVFNKIVSINHFMVAFYQALIEYERYYKVNEYPDSSSEKKESMTYDQYKELKENCLKTFTTEYKSRIKELESESSLLQIKGYDNQYFKIIKEAITNSFDTLIDFNTEVSQRNTEKNELLFDILGQRFLFDNEDMIQCKNSFIKIINEMNYSSKEKITQFDIDHIEKTALSYLEYLRDGSFFKTSNIEDAIYPVIGSYSHGVVSRDGYRYSYVTVNHGKDMVQEKVKLVSEESLNFGEAYYCIPNINRIANIPTEKEEIERIWISPIIIPYYALSSNIKAEISNQFDSKDYDKISELIFQTDEKIYSNLFGNLENAKKVFPILFTSRFHNNSLFYKDNIYVTRIKNESHYNIVAIATFYKTAPIWNTSAMIQAFNEAKVSFPPTFNDACQYFEKAFSMSIGNNCLISDLCVDSELRSRGYGSFIIKQLFKEAEKEGKNLILIAYKDNKKALRFYNSLGFVSYSEDKDSRGANSTNQEEYRMLIKLS